ncbi:MAG: 50S ribosomal protein L9 [Geminicoccaceae bacterium]
MKIILLERVENLGQMGAIVSVRDGFARNFLIPQGKAQRATKHNLEAFEHRRVELEAINLKRREVAQEVAQELDGRSAVIIRQASEGGNLYGSVTARDIVDAFAAQDVTIDRKQVRIDAPLKALGLHEVRIALHPEVDVTVTVNIARSQEEAEIQATGVDVLALQAEQLAAEDAEARAAHEGMGSGLEDDEEL